MVIRGRPQLIMGGGKEGTYGLSAMDGYTLFAMQYQNKSSGSGGPAYSSAFNVVVDMRGNVVSITPTFYDLKEKYHFIALKPYPLDPVRLGLLNSASACAYSPVYDTHPAPTPHVQDYMMGIVDIETTQDGPVYLWNWRKNMPKEFVELANGIEVDCHDINWNVDG